MNIIGTSVVVESYPNGYIYVVPLQGIYVPNIGT